MPAFNGGLILWKATHPPAVAPSSTGADADRRSSGERSTCHRQHQLRWAAIGLNRAGLVGRKLWAELGRSTRVL